MNPMRLLNPKREKETRQERELQKIQAEHAANKWTPIQIRDDRNTIDVDAVLSRSYRKADNE